MQLRHLALQTGPPRVGSMPCPCRPCRPEQFLCLTCQGSSFSVPCRAVPLHFFAFDALPQQIISQPRDAIALQFRGDPWQVSALALHHSALLNFAVAGLCYAVAYPALLMAMPLLHGSALCPCPSVLRSAVAWLRKRNYRNPQKYGSQEQMDTKT